MVWNPGPFIASSSVAKRLAGFSSSKASSLWPSASRRYSSCPRLLWLPRLGSVPRAGSPIAKSALLSTESSETILGKATCIIAKASRRSRFSDHSATTICGPWVSILCTQLIHGALTEFPRRSTPLVFYVSFRWVLHRLTSRYHSATWASQLQVSPCHLILVEVI